MPTAQVTWGQVAELLAVSRTYWLCTVRDDAGPHVSPVWGVVVGDVWHGYSERSTVKARNLRTDSRVGLHLDGGEQVLIVYGLLRDLGRPQARPDILDAFAAKYTRPDDLPFLPSVDPEFDVLYALEPERALTWSLSDFNGSQARWRADR